MINYNWTIGPFECTLNQDGLEKVITKVVWELRGTDEDGVRGERYGIQPVGQPDPEAFIPFSELTKEQVQGWLETLINVNEMKTDIDSQITAIKAPVVATLPAPWNV